MTKEQLLALLQIARDAAAVHGMEGDRVLGDIYRRLDEIAGMLERHLYLSDGPDADEFEMMLSRPRDYSHITDDPVF